MINRLLNILMRKDVGDQSWNIALGLWNPTAYSQVTYYLKIVQEEEARSHLVPKETNPIFLIKVTGIVGYISLKHEFCVS